MADGNKSYVGDIGTEIIVDCGVSIADASVIKLMILKPGSITEVEWSGSIYNNNYIKYTVIDGDFSIAGTYKCQSYIVTADGEWRGETTTFKVYDEFK